MLLKQEQRECLHGLVRMLDQLKQQRGNVQVLQMCPDPVARKTLHWLLIGVTERDNRVQTEPRKIDLINQRHRRRARIWVACISDLQQGRGINVQLQHRLSQKRAGHAPQAGQICLR